MENSKKNISAFEFAILQTADPEEAKNYQPTSKEEELNIRAKTLIDKSKNLRIVKHEQR